MEPSQSQFRIHRKPIANETIITKPINQAEADTRSNRSSSISALSDEYVEPYHGEAVAIAEPGTISDHTAATQNEKQKQNKRPNRIKRLIFFAGPGTLEFWSIVLAWIAFAAIVVVLAVYNHKPQGQWPYRSLTLNGLLALLASIARASLMVGVAAAIGQGKWNWFVGQSPRHWKRRKFGDFEAYDDASRGAWGSLVLLWRRCGLLASSGAIITVMLLGFDTFAQQIIAIEEHQDVVGEVFVPRSQYYNHSGFITTNRDGTTVADIAVKSAVYNGIVNEHLSELPIVCPTGNCTWPIIPTVAVCGSCVDMTPNITKTCTSSYCNYTTPNGLSLDGRITTVQLSDIDAKRYYFRLWSRFEPYSRLWSNAIPDVPSYIAIFQSIGAYPPSDTLTVTSTECALYLCLQGHQVITKNGKTTSEVMWNRTSAKANDIFNYNFTDIGYEPYGSSKASLRAISDSVTSYTFGTVDAYRLAGFDSGWSSNFSSDTIQAFWQASTSVSIFDGFVQNIAKSVSNMIRLQSSAEDAFGGIAITERPYIRIRWAWIAYPAFMMLASPIFLLLTVIQTRRRRICVWKSSVTPVLFTTIDESCRDLHLLADENSINAGELADAVDDVEVQFHEQGIGIDQRRFWSLKSVWMIDCANCLYSASCIDSDPSRESMHFLRLLAFCIRWIHSAYRKHDQSALQLAETYRCTT